MKLSNFVIMLLAISFVLLSCKPIYKCGEQKPAKKAFYIPKIVQTVIDERDSLCTTLSERENEIYSLKKDTTNLSSKITNLEKLNNELINKNVSQNEQFGNSLKQKSDELKKIPWFYISTL